MASRIPLKRVNPSARPSADRLRTKKIHFPFVHSFSHRTKRNAAEWDNGRRAAAATAARTRAFTTLLSHRSHTHLNNQRVGKGASLWREMRPAVGGASRGSGGGGGDRDVKDIDKSDITRGSCPRTGPRRLGGQMFLPSEVLAHREVKRRERVASSSLSLSLIPRVRSPSIRELSRLFRGCKSIRGASRLTQLAFAILLRTSMRNLFVRLHEGEPIIMRDAFVS